MENNLRENLRIELNYQGITIKELSVKTGIPVATLDCYLGSRATIPSVDAAIKIAQALQVSVEYLVIGENANQPQIKSSREAQEISDWIKTLNAEQCKTILKLIKLFK
ncbi:MAG: helix-turn-helix domain-containing protein [Treponema sp.]|jgi:transcriptional regulator with XRE-family HTH domain|nr:helix-turn-helix domain-containing protein [Treponema sp.]